MEIHDVIIIGGGPAGMSAALVLGRCRRRILIFDHGKQRNRMARQMHGYLSRDGINPADFREHALRDLDKYYITIHHKAVKDAEKTVEHFSVTDEDGVVHHARRLLVATGLKDKLPAIPDFEDYYGTSIHHCPICDGWEVRDREIVVHGPPDSVAEAAIYMKHWSKNLVVVTNGEPLSSEEGRKQLDNAGIPVYEEKINKLNGNNGWLKSVEFDDGKSINCDAMFFSDGYEAAWTIPEKLQCRYIKPHEIWVDKQQQSSVEGLYVAGDAAWDMKLVINAAADGAKAAVAIHNSLFAEESNR